MEPVLIIGLVALADLALTVDDIKETTHPTNLGPVKDSPMNDSASWEPIKAGVVVSRALAQRGLGWYKLGAGARFYAPTSFSKEGNQYEGFCDCSGLVAWAFGYRRGNFNTDGIVNDAIGPKKRFRIIKRDEPVIASDIIVRPGPDRNGDGNRDSPGHVGIITGVKPGFVRGGDNWWDFLDVTHCSGRAQNTNDPKTGKRYGATRTTNAVIWKSAGYLVRALHVSV